jgi:hypothetical protein
MVMLAVLLFQGFEKKKDLNLRSTFNINSNQAGFDFMCQFGIHYNIAHEIRSDYRIDGEWLIFLFEFQTEN